MGAFHPNHYFKHQRAESFAWIASFPAYFLFATQAVHCGTRNQKLPGTAYDKRYQRRIYKRSDQPKIYWQTIDCKANATWKTFRDTNMARTDPQIILNFESRNTPLTSQSFGLCIRSIFAPKNQGRVTKLAGSKQSGRVVLSRHVRNHFWVKCCLEECHWRCMTESVEIMSSQTPSQKVCLTFQRIN